MNYFLFAIMVTVVVKVLAGLRESVRHAHWPSIRAGNLSAPHTGYLLVGSQPGYTAPHLLKRYGIGIRPYGGRGVIQQG